MSKRDHLKASHLGQFLAIGGVALLIAAIFMLKEKPQPTVPAAISGDSTEQLLTSALSDNRPTLAFFHSDNCQQCIVMMDTVSQVYPEFSTSVVLVDVNVYDDNNANLLNVVRIQYIPTLIFFDHEGKKQVSVGVMEEEQLRRTLASLAEGY